MGKSSKKANVKIAPSVIPVPSSKPAKKGKRNAEAALEKPVSAKRPKKEIQNVQLKQKDEKKLSKAPPPKKQPQTSSSEDTSSESEEEVKITLKKGAKQPVKQEAKESSSSEDSSSDEESKLPRAAVSSKGLQNTGIKDNKFVSSKKGDSTDSSESDSSSDEDNVTKTIAPSKKPTSVAVPMKKSESSDSSDSDSDEDEDIVQNVAASNKALPAQKSGAAQVSSSGTSDSESDDEKEMAKRTLTAKKNPPKVAAVTALKKKEELSESSESESEEEEVAAKVSVTTKRVAAAPKAGVAAAPKKKVESTSSSESDSDSDEAPAAVPLKTVEATHKKLLSKTQVDDSSEESSDESDEEPQKKKLKLPGTVVGNAAKPNVKSSKKESSSDEDESSGESSDEDLSKAQEKKTKSPESSSSEESSEEDSSEESEDEQPVKALPKKDNGVKMKKIPSINGTEDQIAKKIEKKGEKTPGSYQSAAPGSKTLFVGNLSFDAGEDDIVEFFKEAGEVSDVRLAKGDDGRVRGFGHVEFSTAEAARKAVDELNGKELFGRAIRLDFARERGAYTPHSGKEDRSFQKFEKEQNFTIFVRGFDKSLEMDQIQSTLEEHFGSCGEITRVSLPRDYETGGSKGIGYIDFKDRDAFSKALELDGSELGDYSLTVEEARPRNDSRDGGWSGGRGGGRGGGRSSGGRSDGRGRGGRGGRGRGGGYGGNPYKQSTGTPSQGKKTTFGDD